MTHLETFITFAALALGPRFILAQSSPQRVSAATYITAAEIRTVNAQPGIDRNIRVVDIGNETFAVGVIHRVAAPARGSGRGSGRGGSRGAGAPTGISGPACGDSTAVIAGDATPGGITHDAQTEAYLILSGSGTLVTGGRIANGHRFAADNPVTTTLNGPSCSGAIIGADVVKRAVGAGDVIIIPANVPHAWTGIVDHVDYLSFRPSDHVLAAGYVNPSIASGATQGRDARQREADAVREARAAQNRAIARFDTAAVASFWTEDVAIRRGLGAPVAGREAYRQLFVRDSAAIARGDELIYQREPSTIEVSDTWPLAYEEGTWTGHLRDAAGPAVIGGRYSAQWVKRDGRWLIRGEVYVALTCAGNGCASKAVP
jgi:ketosteroid isomerase-like protein